MYRLITRAAISLWFVLATAASATTISVGAFTPTTTPFVVPVIVSGAVALASFEFDLSYDPSQYRIYTACDPFSGDAYCDFVTGPVTPGSFYASVGYPSLFNPGFILTDATGTLQIGQLLGVEGAWQDPGPAPSGSGILAFIEFIALVAEPTSPIVVGGPAVVPEPSIVPEPSTVALLFAGLALLTMRRSSRGSQASA